MKVRRQAPDHPPATPSQTADEGRARSGGTGDDTAQAGAHTAKRQRSGIGREEQIRPHPPRESDDR
ncbi:hypothetical protein [Streptomyces sp. NPDC091371]|uniref:hypothetical protein n=1 Tax=Streptomyces sp. NPDC091371 TaxID=3155303 RepID=UPI00342A571E